MSKRSKTAKPRRGVGPPPEVASRLAGQRGKAASPMADETRVDHYRAQTGRWQLTTRQIRRYTAKAARQRKDPTPGRLLGAPVVVDEIQLYQPSDWARVPMSARLPVIGA